MSNLNIVRKICACYLSQRREIGASLGLNIQGRDSDLDYVKAILIAAKDQNKLGDVEQRADAFLAVKERH